MQSEKLKPTGIVLMGERAYNSEGRACGDAKFGHWLNQREVMPEMMPLVGDEEDHPGKPCSIGFSAKESLWYGWSHRAVFWFGVGSRVQKGHVGYRPSTPQGLFEKVTRVHADYGYQWMQPEDVELLPDGIRLRSKMTRHTVEHPDGTLGGWVDAGYDYWTLKCGRGEWTAETLEDARQMAIDFAEAVS